MIVFDIGNGKQQGTLVRGMKKKGEPASRRTGADNADLADLKG